MNPATQLGCKFLSMLQSMMFLLWSFLVICLCYVAWLKHESYKTNKLFREQGIKGPPPSLLLGNIPEMERMVSQNSETPQIDGPLIVLPYLKHWTKNYGKLFKFAVGGIQLLYVNNLSIVREINLFTSCELGKPAYLQNDRGVLLGKGLNTANGDVWYHQRKTIAPQLYMHKVKNMVNLMVESGSMLVKAWEKIIDRESEGGIIDIVVDEHVRIFTTYIASKIIFGSDHHKGIKVFPECHELLKAMGETTTLGIPLLRFLPIEKNRKTWRLAKEIHGMIMDIAKERSGSTSHQDLLQAIIEGSKNGELGKLTEDEFIVDNCKNMMLGGYQSPALAAIWGLMLLASHPEWQDRARFELKMVIQEVLRLYPGVTLVSREAMQNVKLGELKVPKGMDIWIWLPALHRNPEYWGADADVFNPERFTNGVTGACKSSQAYIPFGLGARVCPGRNLALIELKVFFAVILSNFKLTISPKYRHSPTYGLLLEPEHGVNLLIQKI
uniref:Cytochrome P450 n=1 Tax=Manihot esculenta TaxID=3983 RepID=A0A2C9W1I8_MANES